MTYNNDCGYPKFCESDRDFAKCKPKHPIPQKILLECGEGNGSTTFTSSDNTPFQLAHVSLDTTCLNKPEILIKFSSTVSMVNLSDIQQTATVILQYELFRVCESEETKSLGIWIFEKVNVAPLFGGGIDQEEESFSFIFCECTNCSKCCEYFVTVTPTDITNATASVNNGKMVALSGGLFDDVKFKQNHPKPKDALLTCGSGNGSVFFRQEFPGVEPPVDIAHITIDTTCLNKPKVLISFSSNIKIDDFIIDTRLQFELFRVCDDGEPISRGIWIFERIGNTSEESNRVFDFTYCECKAPEGCCDYFVTLTPLEIARTTASNSVTIDNVRMTAVSQSSTDTLYCGDYIDCVANSPLPQKIFLECGQGTGSRRFTLSNDSPFQIASVSIDTTCLCRPMVNIEFSSIINFSRITSSSEGQLRYELFRVCENRRPISLGIWMSERIGFLNYESDTNTVNFTFCDSITCPGFCDYFVTVTPIRISNMIVTVDNGRIAALAGEV